MMMESGEGSKGSRSSHHFVSGGMSSMVNVLVTFPLNKLMFRQQLTGATTRAAFGQMRREGWGMLYRGCLPPLLHKTASLSLMFGVFHSARTSLLPHTHTDLAATILAACLSGAVESSLTPFERVQTLLQDHRQVERFRNSAHVARVLAASSDPPAQMYRGLSAVLLRNSLSSAIFFTLKLPVDRLSASAGDGLGQVAANFCGGALLGAVCSTAVYPVNVIKTKMQSQPPPLEGAAAAVEKPVTWRGAFEQVMRERGGSGLRGIYRGIHLNLLRSVLSWGIINASYETFISVMG